MRLARLSGASVAELARKFGVSARHVRRIVREELAVELEFAEPSAPLVERQVREPDWADDAAPGWHPVETW